MRRKYFANLLRTGHSFFFFSTAINQRGFEEVEDMIKLLVPRLLSYSVSSLAHAEQKAAMSRIWLFVKTRAPRYANEFWFTSRELLERA